MRFELIIVVICSACSTEPTCPAELSMFVGNPTYLRYRDAATEGWISPAIDDDGVARVCPSGRYQIVTRCDSEASSVLWYFDALIEQHDNFSRAPRCRAAPEPQVRVEGLVEGAGQVHIGGTFVASQQRSWRYAIDVTPGTYDVVVRDDANVTILRAVDIVDSMPPLELPTITISSGVTTVPVEVSLLDTAPGDLEAYGSTLQTAYGTRTHVSSLDNRVLLLPLADTTSGDLQVVEADVTNATTKAGRGIGRLWSGEPTVQLELLPAFVGPRRNGDALEWERLPDDNFSSLAWTVAGEVGGKVQSQARFTTDTSVSRLDFSGVPDDVGPLLSDVEITDAITFLSVDTEVESKYTSWRE